MTPVVNAPAAADPSMNIPSGATIAHQATVPVEMFASKPALARSFRNNLTLTEIAEAAERVRLALGELFPDTDDYCGGFRYALTTERATDFANRWPEIIAAYARESLRVRLEQRSVVTTEVDYTVEGGAAPRFSQSAEHSHVLIVGGNA